MTQPIPAGVQHVVDQVADLVVAAKPGDRPVLVGITGVDTSGKTTLTGHLANTLRGSNVPVQQVHVDDFHNPRSVRYHAGVPEPEQYYDLSIDFPRLVREVLQPAREVGRLDVELTLLDLASDTFSACRHYAVTRDSVVLVEGVFLLRPEVRRWLDLTVFLHVTEPEVMRRARIRDVPRQGDEVLRKYRDKYLVAQRAYLARHRPDDLADVFVDNTDWSNPVLRETSNRRRSR